MFAARLRLSFLVVRAVLAALSLGFCCVASSEDLRLATTTSTENSGLLRAILPIYEARFHQRVLVIAVGTGKALKLGESGDVDVLLVHAPAAEARFVASGYGVDRRAVMHNDFLLVGPLEDPAKVLGMKDIVAAFARIAQSRAKFISRGDDSGTEQMERSYWALAGIVPAPPWYISAGLGMGEVLNMAAELQAYTLTDRGTYAAFRAKVGLEVEVTGDPRMFNFYHVIAVNPRRYPDINIRDAVRFEDWITSSEGQRAIAEFKINGEAPFFPDAPAR